MRDTSLDAYDRIQERLTPARAAVYQVLVERGPLTDQQVAEALGWPINEVTPRRGELAKCRCVSESGTVTDPVTGCRRTLWQATTDYFAPPPKPATRAKELAAVVEAQRIEIEALRAENARLKEALRQTPRKIRMAFAESTQKSLFAD